MNVIVVWVHLCVCPTNTPCVCVCVSCIADCASVFLCVCKCEDNNYVVCDVWKFCVRVCDGMGWDVVVLVCMKSRC